MKTRQWIVSLFALGLLAGTVGFISAAHNKKVVTQEAPPPPSEPPAEVVYSAFFHFVVELQRQAAELDNEGQEGYFLRDYVKTQTGLTDQEARRLGEISAACVEAVSQQDGKALVVIQKFRSQFPGGRIPAGVKIPPPPPELKVLQQERNQIILAAKGKLAIALGETSFDRVATFARSRITFNTQPIPSDKR